MSPASQRLAWVFVPAAAAACLLLGLIGGAYMDCARSSGAGRIGRSSDFIEFYTAGRMYREDKARLYDFSVQYERQKELLRSLGAREQIGPLPFIYPPLVAAAFSPLARLSYSHAYALWTGISALIFALSGLALLGRLPLGPAGKVFLSVAAAAFVPFSVNCLAGGQLATIAFAVFALAYALLKSGRDASAGAVLALSYYKPPLFAGYLLLCLLGRRWRLLGGFLAAAATLLLASTACVGAGGVAAYAWKALHYRYGHPVMAGYILQMPRSAGLFQALHHVLRGRTWAAEGVYAFCFAAALAVGRWLQLKAGTPRRGSAMFDALFAFEVCLSLALSPHLLDYDLTVLLIPMVLGCCCWLSCAPGWSGIFPVLTLAALYTEFAYRRVFLAWAGFQPLTVLLLFWLCCLGWLLSRLAREPRGCGAG